MPKSKRPKRKHNPRKSLDKLLVGLIISWSDTAPATETAVITDDAISHIKPSMRAHATDLVNRVGSVLISKEILLWQVTMTVVAYHVELQKEWREIREMTARCALCDLEEFSLSQIQDAMNYIGNAEYEKTEFECRVLGR